MIFRRRIPDFDEFQVDFTLNETSITGRAPIYSWKRADLEKYVAQL